MRIRTALTVAGIAGTLVLTQLAGSALAGQAPGPMDEAKELLASYEQTNQRLAACMHDKGLPFDAGLAKSDVVDAFRTVPDSALGSQARDEIKRLTKRTPDDPNGALTAKMSLAEEEAWAGAVNDCSAQLEFEMSGGAKGQAKIAELQRAAKASPEVKAAARTYVMCMRDGGFTVDSDPFVAPQAIMKAEHEDYSPETHALLTRYDLRWRQCVEPYQMTYDQQLFG